MATDVNLNEVLISPLSSMVREISASVADAQRALDAAALASQTQLATEHPELQALGHVFHTKSDTADGSSTLKLKIVPVPPQGRSA